MSLSAEPWSGPLGERVLDAFGPASHWSMVQGRQMWREPTEGQRWSRAVVLCDGQTPVAVAAAFHPRMHPLREWAYVEVAPDRRGRGLGTRALSELRRRLPGAARPLRAKVQAGSPGWRFAVRHGLASIQRIGLVRVTVPATLTEPTALSMPVDVSVGVGVDDDVVAAWRDLYVAGHDWDPPGEVPFELWREFLPSDGVVVRVTRDRVVGIGLVTSQDDGPQFVGGAVARDDPDARGIAECLLAGAASTTAGVLVVELDEWMWEIAGVVDALGHEVIDNGHIVTEDAEDAEPAR